jgi:hypothetical protein
VARRVRKRIGWPDVIVVRGVQSYVDRGLLNNQIFGYRLRGFNASGNGGYSNTAVVSTAAALQALKLNARSVVGGAKVKGTVDLTAPAGAAGITVALESSNPAVAPVVSSIVIPSGQSRGKFTIKTVKPATKKAIATIRAVLRAQSLEANLTVKKK